MAEITEPLVLAGPDPDADALLDILLTGVHDGPVLVQVLRSVDGGPDFSGVVDAAGCSALVDRLLAWKSAAVRAEHDRGAGQLAQLRHVVDNQASRLENYAQQHIADAQRIVELEDAWNVAMGGA